jgi:hypothetical protein
MRAVKRRRARWLAASAGIACAALACQSGYYESYRAAHPGWDGAFPEEGAPLEEVLAALHAPARHEGTRLEVEKLEIWRVEADTSTRIEFEALRAGNADLAADADVVVIVQRTCHAERGLETRDTPRVGYYLLPGRRLSGYDHYDFGKACAVTDQFRAARGTAVPLERVATRRIAAAFGRVPVDLPQLYRRGLSFLEAGRVPDAEAALATGEAGFLELEARAKRGEANAEAFQEAGRLRAQLMRALGVESRAKAPTESR